MRSNKSENVAAREARPAGHRKDQSCDPEHYTDFTHVGHGGLLIIKVHDPPRKGSHEGIYAILLPFYKALKFCHFYEPLLSTVKWTDIVQEEENPRMTWTRPT